MEQQEEYFAFISYKREDEKWAKWLANELEHYHLPTTLNGKDLPKNLRPIFRDVDELSAGNLPKQIYHALSISKNLIVVCSPRSAKLEWVNKEIEDFINNQGGKADNIIPFIIDGTPFSDNEDTECFPPALRSLKSLDIISNAVDVARLGKSESLKRVAEITLGLNKGSLSDSNNNPSFLKRLAKKVGILPQVEVSTTPQIIEDDSIAGNELSHKTSEDKRQYTINTSTLTIRFGNILDSDAEVIVSSDDNELSMGGGVSGAILVNGGEVILDDARKNIPAQLGDVIITTAGKLSQKYIFHSVTIDYADGQRKASEDKGLQEYIIRRSVDKCLRMMPILGIESIAFPAIGAGVAHFSLEEVAMSMADIITDFLYTTSKPYQIEIYLYDRFHQKGVMDFIVFFENVAKSIDNHKKINMLKLEIVESSPVTMSETPKTRPFGKMAASSPNDEHKVFVSYSRDNIEIARLFCEQMDNMGISYWIDVNGKYSGNNFKEVLVDAIDSSLVLLFLSSQESNQSPFVIREISLAVSDNKTILPIKLDDAPYAKSIRFDLSDIDWIEFSKDQCDEAMEKFRYCLQLYL